MPCYMNQKILLLISSLFFTAACSQIDNKGSIHGTLKSIKDKSALSNITVLLRSGEYKDSITFKGDTIQILNSDTLYTISDNNGDFHFNYLSNGTYHIDIKNGAYLDSNISNIDILNNKIDLNEILLTPLDSFSLVGTLIEEGKWCFIVEIYSRQRCINSQFKLLPIKIILIMIF